jgi:signal transduction histidine kinase
LIVARKVVREARPAIRFAAVLIFAFLVVGHSVGSEGQAPARVLMIHSFGRDLAPFDRITAVFRNRLAERLGGAAVFLDATLDAGRPITQTEETAFADYLRARFAGSPPDLVVTVGQPAARFYTAHRAALFSSPLMLGALDERFTKAVALTPSDAAVVAKVELARLYDNILEVLPQTRTIAVVIGSSPLEQFWRKELEREAEPFRDRVDFLWLDNLSLAQIRERIGHLPPHFAVLFTLMLVDASGIPYERLDALAALRASTNAPIFSIYETEIGNGVVGGPYTSQRRIGERMAAMAERVLRSGVAAGPAIDVNGFETPAYDARELQYWNIDESRLPQGSQVGFRPPSLWQQHASAITAIAAVIVLQSALIAALLVQRRRRQRAESEARSLGGRLISAHEDERRRLARELHDDVSQRLAALAIQAAQLDGPSAAPPAKTPAQAIGSGLVELSEDIHALSHRLHPTVIEDLGLVEALRVECDRMNRSGPTRVELDAANAPTKLPPLVAVNLFRIAQEALRNVARHAQASEVRVGLQADAGRLILRVHDNGVGFGENPKAKHASLGIASMRERMRLLDGRLDIDSGPGRGTTITASVPLKEAA